MELIDKAAVVAEIKKLQLCTMDEHMNYYSAEAQEEYNALSKLKSFLDTLEVKEVDLEDSIKESLAQKYIDYTFKRYNIDIDSKEGQLIYYAYMHGMNQCLNQLKTQKGE